MAWFNFKSKNQDVEEKLNPAQPYYDHKTDPSREPTFSYERAYEELEVVNRAVNMLVDDAADIPVYVGDQFKGSPIIKGMRKSRVDILLNQEPNPFQDISTFRRNCIIDLIMDGNIFIYYDGVHLYHLPASKVNIHSDPQTYISKFTFLERVDFSPSEIIHIKDNSFYSIYRGVSRLKPALRQMILLRSMRRFQDNFFKNGAVPGLVIKSPNTLSEKIKDRLLMSWQQRYNPESGGHRPLILDGGLELDRITTSTFKDLDFKSAVQDSEYTILKAIGVPPILMDSGNNANLRPNHRLYYLETVIPIVRKMNAAFSRYFGYVITEELTDVHAVQPELREQASYFSTLVNGGVLTPNEARKALGFDVIKGHDELRIPANIAGSAANPSEGGRPTEGED
jgi:HK97 family phage portal protein